jgi:hypothetical protein
MTGNRADVAAGDEAGEAAGEATEFVGSVSGRDKLEVVTEFGGNPSSPFAGELEEIRPMKQVAQARITLVLPATLVIRFR